MRKEEVVSGFVMCIVSGLVMVGFTIAWFTIWHYSPVVTGLEVRAAEIGDIDVVIDETDLGEFAPGSSGKVLLTITPEDDNVFGCRVVPQLLITQDNLTKEQINDGEGTWYPNDSVETEEGAVTIEELYRIANSHIQFFADEDCTIPVTQESPLEVKWDSVNGAGAKEMEIFWKWYYEYPLTEAELEEISDAEQELLDTYDEEDMTLGNNITNIKFDFVFAIQ